MPEKTVATFEVKYLQIMDETGKIDSKLMPKLASQDVINLYKGIVTTRIFDDRMLKMQREGRIGTIALSLGQEAVTVGSAYASGKDDWIVPSFREQGALLLKGVSPHQLFQFWGGDERGHFFDKKQKITPISIPVGSQAQHAVGIAYAAKLRKENSAVLVYFGDGATSTGDVAEAINFAGVFGVPVVFINQNNQWAISVPRENQSHAQTLAQKAFGGGIKTIQIDGNDIFAVYKATKEAIESAKKGYPYFIECVTYRLSDHTTSDDASKYRDPKLVEAQKKKDPLIRLEKYIDSKKILSKKEKEKVWKDAEDFIDKEVQIFEKIKPPELEDMFKYTFAEMTDDLRQQLEEVKQIDSERPKDG